MTDLLLRQVELGVSPEHAQALVPELKRASHLDVKEQSILVA